MVFNLKFTLDIMIIHYVNIKFIDPSKLYLTDEAFLSVPGWFALQAGSYASAPSIGEANGAPRRALLARG